MLEGVGVGVDVGGGVRWFLDLKGVSFRCLVDRRL